MQEQDSRFRLAGRGDKTRVIAYIRESTEDQAQSGLGLEAQRNAADLEIRRRGWTSVELIEDAGYSAKDLRRPGIQRALAMLGAGEADALLVTKLDRLSRSMLDFASIMELSRKQSWQLVMLDVGVDTTTPAGEMLVSVLATFAQFERRLIGQRTREALAVKRREGVQLGRPERVAPELCERIRHERDLGYSFRRIARNLTCDGVPTVQGGTQWWPSTVQGVLMRCEA